MKRRFTLRLMISKILKWRLRHLSFPEIQIERNAFEVTLNIIQKLSSFNALITIN